MTDAVSPRIAELRGHEEELVFASFDHHDAWRLGSLIVNRAIPVRVRGTGVVAAVTASGLSSDDDHQLVVDSIRTYLKEAAD